MTDPGSLFESLRHWLSGFDMWDNHECDQCGSTYASSTGKHNKLRYWIWRTFHV